jgi:hypothetical protein
MKTSSHKGLPSRLGGAHDQAGPRSGRSNVVTKPASNACAIVTLLHMAGFASMAIDG